MSDVFLKWDPVQVSSYVRSVLPEEDQYLAGNFLHHNIEGNLLPLVTTQHLQEMGIANLRTRLVIKRAISELISDHYDKFPLASFNDSEYNLSSFNINNNYVSIESLTLSSILVKDILKKLAQLKRSPTGSYGSSDSDLQIKQLQESVTKLKAELVPMTKLLKKTKPLPTPTLDPGVGNLALESPTFSLRSEVSDPGQSQDGHSAPNKSPSYKDENGSGSGTFQPYQSAQVPSPTFSKRHSSGTLLSMGTGKIVQQAFSDAPRSHDGKFSSFSDDRPRLVEHKSQPGRIGQTVMNEETKPPLKQAVSATSINKSHNLYSQPGPQNEPLKQLRASSDDSCLKILQQAMKRYHIPRTDWSKYVLVVCYGDKERILKLAEKPVSIVKELHELGRHPTIMLRQLAEVSEEGVRYEDSRIADIPGGSL